MKPIDTFQNRLQKAIDIRNIKPVELHEKTGISESLISKYLSGNAVARQKKISLLSDALNVNPVWLMGYDIPMEKDIKLNKFGTPVILLNVLGTVKAGYDGIIQEEIIDKIEVSQEFINSNKEYLALKIKGDSMFPVLFEDDIVLVQKQENFDNGDIVVVLINGDEATVKKAKKTDTSILLQPLNNNYEPLIFSKEDIEKIPIKIIGIVKRILDRDLKKC